MQETSYHIPYTYHTEKLSNGNTIKYKEYIETKSKRVWLSRMTIEDGQPYNNQVTIEHLTDTPYSTKISFPRWEITEQYEAK